MLKITPRGAEITVSHLIDAGGGLNPPDWWISIFLKKEERGKNILASRLALGGKKTSLGGNLRPTLLYCRISCVCAILLKPTWLHPMGVKAVTHIERFHW